MTVIVNGIAYANHGARPDGRFVSWHDEDVKLLARLDSQEHDLVMTYDMVYYRGWVPCHSAEQARRSIERFHLVMPAIYQREHGAWRAIEP